MFVYLVYDFYNHLDSRKKFQWWEILITILTLIAKYPLLWKFLWYFGKLFLLKYVNREEGRVVPARGGVGTLNAPNTGWGNVVVKAIVGCWGQISHEGRGKDKEFHLKCETGNSDHKIQLLRTLKSCTSLLQKIRKGKTGNCD